MVGIIVVTCLSGLLAIEIMNGEHQKIEDSKVESQANNLQSETDTCWVQIENENESVVVD